MITVEYDGEYPVTCMGTLVIRRDGEVIYEKKYCCHSTGAVWFDENWNEHVEAGRLIWDDADKWDKEVRDAVEDKLSDYWVCCGGCV